MPEGRVAPGPRLPSGVQIRDVRTVLLTGPFSADPFFLRQRLRRDAAFVEVETENGVVGWGRPTSATSS